MYKLVVFDLDGTLANTLKDLATAMNTALSAEGLPTHPTESYNQFVGNGINNLVKQVLLDKRDDEALCKKVREHFDVYYNNHLCDETVAYDGMVEILQKLSLNNVLTAVHSNKPHAYVPFILDKLFTNHKFDIAWGHQKCYERKPSAQALEAIMQKLKVDRGATLYVGDSDVDVLTAHNAGVKVCGVEWGFRGRQELLSAGADFIAKDANELMKIIEAYHE